MRVLFRSTFPGIGSTFIGPFNNFDARARLVQSVFSLAAIRNYQAGKAGVRLAQLQEGLAREQVATFTALTYLEALRARGAAGAGGALPGAHLPRGAARGARGGGWVSRP